VALAAAASARATGSGAASSAAWSGAAAVQAAVANADADLYHFCASVSKRVTAAASWGHDVFRCGTLLVWSLFLKRVRLLHPGGAAVAESDEEVQQLVLEGLGGAEGQGFWIHLRQTLATNPGFASLKRGTTTVGSGIVDEEEQDAAASAAAANDASSAAAAASSAAAAASTGSSIAPLVEELGEVLSEFLHHVLLLHGKEMDLLRREDKKSSRAYDKTAARHAQLQAQQAQQAQMQFLQHGGYGQTAATAPLGELAPPPQLNFAAFLSVLSQLARACPALVPLLWSDPAFETFLASELHDSKADGPGASGSMLGEQSLAVRLGLHQSGTATPGNLLSGAGGHSGSAGQSSSSSSSIFTSDSPFVLGYLDLLSSLCVDAACAMRVYGFVRACSRVSWETVCVHYLQQGLIAHYMPPPPQSAQQAAEAEQMHGFGRRGGAYGYGQQAQQPHRAPAAAAPPPLTARQLHLLSSLLRLLSAVVRPSAALQRFFALHADFRLLDTAFGLLALRLPVQAKARVLELLASLARLNPELAAMVWERLERSQVLPTVHFASTAALAAASSSAAGYASRPLRPVQPSLVPAGAPLEGLLFDLEEVENQLQLYPLTGAFLFLLVTLLESAPLPTQLGQGVRGSSSTANTLAPQLSLSSASAGAALYGLAPYMSFVHSHVFLNLPHRGYARSSEQSQLAELCLASFAQLADDFLRDMALLSDDASAAANTGVESGSATFQARHQPLSFQAPVDSAAGLYGRSGANGGLSALLSHPAYPLLRDLLQGKEVLAQVLVQMHAAFAQLDESEGGLAIALGGAAATHPSVEGTLLQALRLLWLLLEQEESLVSTMQQLESAADARTAGGFGGLQERITPLSSLLLQHQPAVLTLAKCVGYLQSHTGTPVQQLQRDHLAKERARKAAAGSDGQQAAQLAVVQQQSPANQSFGYDQDELSEDPLLAAAAAAAASAPSAVDIDDGRTSEAAFFASSCLLLLSQRDEARLVHILEASGATAAVVAAAQRQMKNVQLPAVAEGETGAVVSSDPDLQCNRARLVLVDLLLSSLTSPSPASPHLSLALLLLGFDVATPAAVRATDLTRSTRRGLLDTLLLELAPQPGFARRFPSLAQGVMRLLYTLLTSPLTSGPMLRLLQASPSASSAGNGLATYLLSLLRGLPIVSDVRGMLREWSADEAALARMPSSNDGGSSSGGIALVKSSALSSRVYHSLFQLSWLLRSVSLHFFVLVGAQARARGGQGAGETWLLDEEAQSYLQELGFLSPDADEEQQQQQDAAARAADEARAFAASPTQGRDWFSGGAQSASSFLADLERNSAPSSGARSMLLLNILSNIHAFLRTALPPSFSIDPLPVDTDAVLSASGSSAAPSSAASNVAVAGSSSSGVRTLNFEFAQAKYFDAQLGALQYSLREVYAGCAAAGLSPALRLAVTRRCLEWNAVSSVLGCAKASFDAWRQSVEVVLATSADLLMRAEPAAFETTLLRLLHALLDKLSPSEERNGSAEQSVSVWTALGEELSGLALTLISTLRDLQRYTSSMPSGAAASASSWGGEAGAGVSARATQWHGVLSLLVSSILSTRHSPTRSNLYAVFLHYMLLATARRRTVERALETSAALSAVTAGAAAEPAGAAEQWSAIQAEQARCDAANLSLLSSHNLPLLKLVVGDALEGSSKLRSLAFRFLSVLLLGASPDATAAFSTGAPAKSEMRGPSRFFSVDRDAASSSSALPSSFTSSLLDLFSKNNLLLLFLNQLRAHDQAVQAAIHASGARALQGYELLLQAEACLGFLLQLAQDEEGAVLLQEHQTVRVLASLGFLHARPGVSYGAAEQEAAGGNLPTPLDKFLSVHTLALQLIASLLRALPSHSVLLAHAQNFVASQAQRDALAALLHEARPNVTAQSLEGLTSALALLYQGARVEQAAAATELADAAQAQQEQQRKLQKLNGGTRLTMQPRTGIATDPLWEQQQAFDADGVSSTPFLSLLRRQQGALLSLLLRYFRPSGDARLRSYLSARLLERQLRLEQGDAGAAGNKAAGGAADEADSSDASVQAETLLEQGDSAVQRIMRQLLSLLVLLTEESPATPLFGPQLESSADARFDDSRADGSDAQLASLVAMLQEAHARMIDAQRQVSSLKSSLAQLADVASPSDESRPSFGGSIGNGVGGSRSSALAGANASAIAALELQFFPPSAAALFALYQELPPAGRRVQLQQAAVRALRAAQSAREASVWTLEHALLLLHQHVRLYLPASSPLGLSAARGRSSASVQVSPAEFRDMAEENLAPVLRDLLRALTPHAQSAQANGGDEDGEQRVALYAGSSDSTALVLSSSATASRLLAASFDTAAAGTFIPALLQRMFKIISA